MELHTSVDRVSNGPKKGVITIIGLLLAIASFTGGLLVQSFRAGSWTANMTSGVAHNRADINAQNLQLQGIITSLQSIIILDSAQNYQIRRNSASLEEIKLELRAHRSVSERQ